MAGVKGRSGGARPGSGRKSTATEGYQAQMRSVITERVTREDWAMVVEVALAHAKAGKSDARDWLSAWIVGAVPKEVTGQVDTDGRFVFVIE